MTHELRLALAVSAGLHGAALIGLPLGDGILFDVERAPTSLEIFVVAKPSPMVAAVPEPPVEPPDPAATVTQSPEEPAPDTRVAPEQRGVLTEVLPSYLRNPPPVYPTSARRRGEQGTVLLRLEVLPSGRCGRIQVASSSGVAALDEEALRTLQAWRFRPAQRGGLIVPVWVEIPVTFRLVD